MSHQGRIKGASGWTAIGSSLLRMVVGVAFCLVAGCSGGQPVTPQSIADARKVWEQAGIRDYDLEWTATGMNNAHYLVTVRGGTVRKIESIARDGRRFEVHPAEVRFYGVDG